MRLDHSSLTPSAVTFILWPVVQPEICALIITGMLEATENTGGGGGDIQT